MCSAIRNWLTGACSSTIIVLCFPRALHGPHSMACAGGHGKPKSRKHDTNSRATSPATSVTTVHQRGDRCITYEPTVVWQI